MLPDYINTVSPTFLNEVVEGKHNFIPYHIQNEIKAKKEANCAIGILNAPDEQFDPEKDKDILYKYNENNFEENKKKNKIAFQLRTGLDENSDAPLFFWPSRLDPIQKGCQLLADIMYKVLSKYWDDNLQIAIVANGIYQSSFKEIVRFHGFQKRVCVVDFDEILSHQGYAASDFMLNALSIRNHVDYLR